ncbi:MAG TPA: hypothetical protein VIK57_01265 [Streptosporangiaceae bacterium]
MDAAAESARSTASGLSTSSTAVQSLAQPWNIGRSAAGMPSSSPITVTGSGNANAATKSVSAAEASRSHASATIRSTAGRSAAIRRAVNVADTRRRSRVWSGGLSIRMLVNISRRAGRSAQSG